MPGPTSNMYGTPQLIYAVGNNVLYPADGNGRIVNVAQVDVQSLVDQGCISEAQWLKVQAAHPSTNPSSGSSGTVQKADGSGAFLASGIVDNGTHVSISEPVLVNGSPLSGGGTVTAVSGAATLNAQNGIVTSEALTSANSYTLTLTNSVILAAARSW